jgi:hypothetical protein
MTNQMNVPENKNFTFVKITLNFAKCYELRNTRDLTFVTDTPYRNVVLRVLRNLRAWQDGEITRDIAMRNIVGDLPHWPMFGPTEDYNDFVDEQGGHHVCVDFDKHRVYMGRNKDQNTWGEAVCGARSEDIAWATPAGEANFNES